MKKLIEQSHIESSLLETYQRALDLNLYILTLWPENHSYIWPSRTSDSFLDLCHRGYYIAQVIFMFYGITLHLDSDKWYVSKAGKQLVSSVLEHMGAEREIPSEWMEIIQWIRQFVDVY